MLELLLLITLAVVSSASWFDAYNQITQVQWTCLKNVTGSVNNMYIPRIYLSNGQVDQVGIGNLISSQQTSAFLYISPCVVGSCPSPRDQFSTTINALNRVQNFDIQRSVVFIDVTKYTWSPNATYNRDFLRQMIWQSAKMEVLVGVYTNAQDWETVMGDMNYAEFSSMYLWWNSIGDASLDGFMSFGGWTIYGVTLRHYKRNMNVCGLTINLSYESFIEAYE